MKIYEANKHQPNICMSLCSEWLLAMSQGVDNGEHWCKLAFSAVKDDAFYIRHGLEQANLTSTEQLNTLKTQQQFLNMICSPTVTIFPNRYLNKEVMKEFLNARKPTIDSISSKKTDKIMLMRHRRLRVLRGTDTEDLNTLKKEFKNLGDEPRYYIISVKAKASQSHAIGVVSTKKNTFFKSGHLYYYDPNLNKVVRWDKPEEINTFLDKVLLVDYASINHIWQVAPL